MEQFVQEEVQEILDLLYMINFLELKRKTQRDIL